MNGFDVTTLKSGAAGEQIGTVNKQIFENIMNPNTDNEKARKMTITITYKPLGDDEVSVSVTTKATLSPINEVKTMMLFGKTPDGDVVCNEWDKDTMKNQLVIEEEKTITEDEEVVESTGVIDFQKNRKAE